MARFEQIDPEQATGKPKELLDEVEALFGSVPNGFKVLAASPRAFRGYLDFENAVADGVLSEQVRQQIAILVSNANECGYCLSAYTAAAGAAGVSEDDLVAARRGEASDAKSDAVLRFAKAVVDSRGDVPDEVLAEAREAALSDQELIEVVAIVALKTFTNYSNRLARPELDFPEVEIEAVA